MIVHEVAGQRDLAGFDDGVIDMLALHGAQKAGKDYAQSLTARIDHARLL